MTGMMIFNLIAAIAVVAGLVTYLPHGLRGGRSEHRSAEACGSGGSARAQARGVTSGVLAVRRTRSNASANMPTANVATAHASAVATAARSTFAGSAARTTPLVRVGASVRPW
jgi:hypothetical protein